MTCWHGNFSLYIMPTLIDRIFRWKVWQFPVSHNISWIVLQRFPATSWSVSILHKFLQNTMHCSHWNLNFDVANSLYVRASPCHSCDFEWLLLFTTLTSRMFCSSCYKFRLKIPDSFSAWFIVWGKFFGKISQRQNVTSVRLSCFFSAQTSPKNWWILS